MSERTPYTEIHEIPESVWYVSSTSKIKTDTVLESMNEMFPGFDTLNVIGMKVPSDVHEQPRGLDMTLLGALNRLSHMKEQLDAQNIKASLVSIENGIELVGKDLTGKDIWMDLAIVVVMDKNGNIGISNGAGVRFPNEYVDEARKRGFKTTTVGSIMEEKLKDKSIGTDPHAFLTHDLFPRKKLLKTAFKLAYAQLVKNSLSEIQINRVDTQTLHQYPQKSISLPWLLSSENPSKTRAVVNGLRELYGIPDTILDHQLLRGIPTKHEVKQISNLQNTCTAARQRFQAIEQFYRDNYGNYPIVSIQNGIQKIGFDWESNEIWIDLGIIMIKDPKGNLTVANSAGIRFPTAFVSKAEQTGFDLATVGEEMKLIIPEVDPLDPHSYLTGYRFTREQILREGFELALAQLPQ